MAGPCCGLISNSDVLEGNLVPLSKKGNREKIPSIVNTAKHTAEDQAVGHFKSHLKSVTLSHLQPLKSGRRTQEKLVGASASSKCLPLCIHGSQHTKFDRPSSSQEPVHSDDTNEEASVMYPGISDEESFATLKTNAAVGKRTFYDGMLRSVKVGFAGMVKEDGMLRNPSTRILDNSAAHKRSISQPTSSHTLNSYQRQVFVVPSGDSQRLRRQRNSSDTLHASDSDEWKGASRTCPTHRRIRSMDPSYSCYGKDKSEDSEEKECEVDGNICLSSFTFASLSQRFSTQEDDPNYTVLHPDGKKLLMRQSTRESSNMSIPPLNYTKERLSPGSFVNPSFTKCTPSTSRNCLQTCQDKDKDDRGQGPGKRLFSNKENDLQVTADLSLSPPKLVQDYKVISSDVENMKLKSSDNFSLPPLKQKKPARADQPIQPERSCFNHSRKVKKKGSMSEMSKWTCMGKRYQTSCSVLGFKQGQPLESSFDLGVGIGVLYMLVASHKEVERLNKLMGQTESVVQAMKQQLQAGKNLCHGFSSISGNLKVEKDDIHNQEAMERECQKIQDEFVVQICDATPQTKNQSAAQTVVEPVPESIDMAELEAALEAELELMHFNLISGSTLNDQASTAVSDEEIVVVFPNDPTSSGDALPQDLDQDDRRKHSSHEEVHFSNYAVSPGALGRRLHEVLEERQEERILELESQLEATETNLAVKERELQCWKDIVHQLIKFSHANSVDNSKLSTINKDGALFSLNRHPDHLTLESGEVENNLEALVSQVQCDSSHNEHKTSTQQNPYTKENFSYQQYEDIKTVDSVAVPTFQDLKGSVNDIRVQDPGTSLAVSPSWNGYVHSCKTRTGSTTSQCEQTLEFSKSSNQHSCLGDVPQSTALAMASTNLETQKVVSTSVSSTKKISHSIIQPGQRDNCSFSTAAEAQARSNHSKPNWKLGGDLNDLDLDEVSTPILIPETSDCDLDEIFQVNRYASPKKISQTLLYPSSEHEWFTETPGKHRCDFKIGFETSFHGSSINPIHKREPSHGHKIGAASCTVHSFLHAGANTPVESFKYRDADSISKRSCIATTKIFPKIKHWEETKN